MKRNLLGRIATAVAFVGIAAMVSACGSSSDTAGIIGGAITNGSGYLSGTQAVAFSGVAEMDQIGNIYAGQNVGPLTLSAAGAVQPGGYQYGRVNSTDGSTLEFNTSGSYGSQLTIQGVYMMGEDVYSYINGGMPGYGYGTGIPTTGYTYGTGGGVSSITLYEMGTELMTEAASVIGEQPFEYAIVSGELVLNNEIDAPY